MMHSRRCVCEAAGMASVVWPKHAYVYIACIAAYRYVFVYCVTKTIAKLVTSNLWTHWSAAETANTTARAIAKSKSKCLLRQTSAWTLHSVSVTAMLTDNRLWCVSAYCRRSSTKETNNQKPCEAHNQETSNQQVCKAQSCAFYRPMHTWWRYVQISQLALPLSLTECECWLTCATWHENKASWTVCHPSHWLSHALLSWCCIASHCVRDAEWAVIELRKHMTRQVMHYTVHWLSCMYLRCTASQCVTDLDLAAMEAQKLTARPTMRCEHGLSHMLLRSTA